MGWALKIRAGLALFHYSQVFRCVLTVVRILALLSLRYSSVFWVCLCGILFTTRELNGSFLASP